MLLSTDPSSPLKDLLGSSNLKLTKQVRREEIENKGWGRRGGGRDIESHSSESDHRDT